MPRNPNPPPKETWWKAGQPSPNPSGRPKGVPNTATRLKRILELVQDKKNPVTGVTEQYTVAEMMDMAQVIKALKGDTRAYNELVNRLEGRAKQDMEITGLPENMGQVQHIIEFHDYSKPVKKDGRNKS